MSVHRTAVSPCDLDVRIRPDSLDFVYGPGVYGPPAEIRRLDAIRESLRDPECAGPEEIYGIAMDVGKLEHRRDLEQRYLLFGFVVYAPGLMGEEPVRSQGHVHAIAPHCGWSTPEVFEIWEGRAIIYAQQRAEDDPGRCIAVQAGPGEKVVVPPGWAHCVINADPSARLLFCALCERQYGFVYDGVRSRHGLAWYPIVRGEGIAWERNEHYRPSELHLSGVRHYPELSISTQMSLYSQYETSPASLQWVSEPARVSDLWPVFDPGADS
jgi:glucose-6-phosphate isomerase